MTPLKLDIHEYDKRYSVSISNLKNGTINHKTGKTEKTSERNIELILKFDNRCKKEGLSLPRRERIIGALNTLAKHFIKKDFDKVNREDMEKIQDLILDAPYSLWTKKTYFSILKKFFKWLEYGDNYGEKQGYPEVVRGLNTSVKSKDAPKINSSSILTEEEIQRMIDNANNIRDKAFISMIYELGARVSEVGNLRIKDCVREQAGYTINLRGKTGERTPILIQSDAYLTLWLDQHPIKKPEAPLWVSLAYSNKLEPMHYQALRKIVDTLAKKSNIMKRVHPHIFRHSRVTHLLLNGDITETQAKVYFGWTPDSRQLNTYSHLTSQDVNDKLKAKYGLLKKEDKEELHKSCFRCKLINPKNSHFCQRCGLPLDTKTAFDLKEKETQTIESVKKMLMEQGVFDKIALEIAKERGL